METIAEPWEAFCPIPFGRPVRNLEKDLLPLCRGWTMADGGGRTTTRGATVLVHVQYQIRLWQGRHHNESPSRYVGTTVPSKTRKMCFFENAFRYRCLSRCFKSHRIVSDHLGINAFQNSSKRIEMLRSTLIRFSNENSIQKKHVVII